MSSVYKKNKAPADNLQQRASDKDMAAVLSGADATDRQSGFSRQQVSLSSRVRRPDEDDDGEVRQEHLSPDVSLIALTWHWATTRHTTCRTCQRRTRHVGKQDECVSQEWEGEKHGLAARDREKEDNDWSAGEHWARRGSSS